MKNPIGWVKRLLAEKPEQKNDALAQLDAEEEAYRESQSAIVQMGIFASGTHLMLCAPDAPRSGVKLVAVSKGFVERYNALTREYAILQSQLAELPQSLRKRKRKAKVDIPDLET